MCVLWASELFKFILKKRLVKRLVLSGPIPDRFSRHDLGLRSISCVSCFVWKSGLSLLGRRGFSIKVSFASIIFTILQLSNSKFNCLILG